MHDTIKERLERASQQPGLADLRDAVLHDDPDAQHVYELSADRAALGAKLKLRRRCAAATLQQLAEIIGWSPEAIAEIESATAAWPSLSDVRAYLRGCRRAVDRPNG